MLWLKGLLTGHTLSKCDRSKFKHSHVFALNEDIGARRDVLGRMSACAYLKSHVVHRKSQVTAASSTDEAQKARVSSLLSAMASPTVKLNSGFDMPIIGLGTYDDLKDDQISDAIVMALQAGYRHIDTAWNYQCEKAVGEGLRQKLQDGSIKREDLFITTKLWNTCHRRAEAAVRESLADLGLDYLDMYLMHFPMAFKYKGRIGVDPPEKLTPDEPDDVDYIDTWREMEKLVDKGLVRSIGVSNFTIEQLTRLLNVPNIKYRPSYIQIEVHPYFTNSDLVDFCQKEGIVVTAYAPLGRAGTDYWGNKVANILEEPIVLEMAAKYKKNPGQVALRWAVQRGMAVVPKSTNPGRLKSNIELFDFKLTLEEMAAISGLNKNQRVCTHYYWKDFPNFPWPPSAEEQKK